MEFVQDLAYTDEETKITASQMALRLIEELAESWGISQQEACSKLLDVNALDGYFFKYYDVLHTQGVNYLVEDLLEYVNEKELEDYA